MSLAGVLFLRDFGRPLAFGWTLALGYWDRICEGYYQLLYEIDGYLYLAVSPEISSGFANDPIQDGILLGHNYHVALTGSNMKGNLRKNRRRQCM